MNPDNNNPAGEPPVDTSVDPNVSGEILDILSLNDTPSAADAIADKAGKKPAETPAAPASAEPAAASGEPATAPGSPVTPEPSAPPPPPPAPAATPPAPATSEQPAQQPPGLQVDEQALKTASLEAERDALRRELEALRANPQQPGAPAPQPAAAPSPEQPAEKPVGYALTLPDQLKADLVSDDPEKTIGAIGTIVNSLGTIVHNNVVTQLRGEFNGMLTRLAGAAQEEQLGEQRKSAETQARDDYYKAFPAHNDPLILPIIQQQAQKMAAEFPGLGWSPEYQNALGARVNNALATLRGGQPPASEPTPATPTVPAKPAGMLPSGQRGTVAPVEGDLSRDVVDILDPFSAG